MSEVNNNRFSAKFQEILNKISHKSKKQIILESHILATAQVEALTELERVGILLNWPKSLVSCYERIKDARQVSDISAVENDISKILEDNRNEEVDVNELYLACDKRYDKLQINGITKDKMNILFNMLSLDELQSMFFKYRRWENLQRFIGETDKAIESEKIIAIIGHRLAQIENSLDKRAQKLLADVERQLADKNATTVAVRELTIEALMSEAAKEGKTYYDLVVEVCPELRAKFQPGCAFSDEDKKLIEEYSSSLNLAKLPGYTDIVSTHVKKYYPKVVNAIFGGKNRERYGIRKMTAKKYRGQLLLAYSTIALEECQMSRAGAYDAPQDMLVEESIDTDHPEFGTELMGVAKVIPNRVQIESEDLKVPKAITGYEVIYHFQGGKTPLVGKTAAGRYEDILRGQEELTLEEVAELKAATPEYTIMCLGISSTSNLRKGCLELMIIGSDDAVEAESRRLMEAGDRATGGAYRVFKRSLELKSVEKYGGNADTLHLVNTATGDNSEILKAISRLGQTMSPSTRTEAVARKIAILNDDFTKSPNRVHPESGDLKNLDGASYAVDRLLLKALKGLGIKMTLKGLRGYLYQFRANAIKGALIGVSSRSMNTIIRYGRNGLKKAKGVNTYEANIGCRAGIVFVVDTLTPEEQHKIIDSYKQEYGSDFSVEFVFKDNATEKELFDLSAKIQAGGEYKGKLVVVGTTDLSEVELYVDTNSMKLMSDLNSIVKKGIALNIMAVSDYYGKQRQVLNTQFNQGVSGQKELIRAYKAFLLNLGRQYLAKDQNTFNFGGATEFTEVNPTYYQVDAARLGGAVVMDYDSQVSACLANIKAQIKHIDKLRFAEVEGFYLMGTGDLANMFGLSVVHDNEVFVPGHSKKAVEGFLGRTPQSHKYGGLVCTSVTLKEVLMRINALDFDGDKYAARAIKDCLKEFYSDLQQGSIVCPSMCVAFFGQLDGPDFDGDHFFWIVNPFFVRMMKKVEHFIIEYDGNADRKPRRFHFGQALRPVIEAAFGSANEGVGIVNNKAVNITQLLAMFDLDEEQYGTMFLYALKKKAKSANIGCAEPLEYKRVFKEGYAYVTQDGFDAIENNAKQAMFVPQTNADFALCIENLRNLFKDLLIAFAGATGKTIDSTKTLAVVTLCCQEFCQLVKSGATLRLELKVNKDGTKKEAPVFSVDVLLNKVAIGDWKFKQAFYLVKRDEAGNPVLADYVDEAGNPYQDYIYIDEKGKELSKNDMLCIEWKPVGLTLDDFATADHAEKSGLRVLLAQKDESSPEQIFVLDDFFVVKAKLIKAAVAKWKQNMARISDIRLDKRYKDYGREEYSIKDSKKFSQFAALATNMHMIYKYMQAQHGVTKWVRYITDYFRSVAYRMGYSTEDVAKMAYMASLGRPEQRTIETFRNSGEFLNVVCPGYIDNFYSRFAYEQLLLLIEQFDNSNYNADVLDMQTETPAIKQNLFLKDVSIVEDNDLIKFEKGQSALDKFWVKSDDFTGIARVFRNGNDLTVKMPVKEYCENQLKNFRNNVDMPVALALKTSFANWDNADKLQTASSLKVEVEKASGKMLLCFKTVDETGLPEEGKFELFAPIAKGESRTIEVVDRLLDGKEVQNFRVYVCPYKDNDCANIIVMGDVDATPKTMSTPVARQRKIRLGVAPAEKKQ